MLQYILHERRIWRHFGGKPSHELTDAATKRIPETESPANTPPFRTPRKSRFNPNGNRSKGRAIDNIRTWGTGALNIGALLDHYGFWPNTLFTHRKATKEDHQSDHPSVKPVPLIEDLCTLLCPQGGKILDPFAGTGTTGVAARNKGYDCVLVEQDAAMQSVIHDRLRREA